MTLAQRVADLRRRVAATPTDALLLQQADEAVRALDTHARRALGWIAEGREHEAAAYAEDCGNLARCIVETTADAAFAATVPAVAQLPSRADIESLVMAPVSTQRDRAAVDTWVAASIELREADERLAALAHLKKAQPRVRLWTRLATPLADAVVDSVEDRVNATLASGDEAAMRQLQQDLVQIGITTEGRGAKTLMRIESALQERAQVSEAHRVRATAMALHVSWARMDETAAADAAASWASLLERADVDATSTTIAAGPLSWLASCAQRVVAAAAAADLVDDLDRGLDEERSVAELERRYAALQRQDVAVPPRVVARLRHRITEARASRRRRWAVCMGTLATIAVVIIVAIVIGDRTRRQELLATNIETAINRMLAADDPAGAQNTLQDAIANGHIDTMFASAIGARIDRHRENWTERFNRSREALQRATTALLGPDSESLFDTVEADLEEARTSLPRGADLEIEAIATRLRDRRIAWGRAQRDELRPRLDALNVTISATEPDQRDLAAWKQRREALAGALAELNVIAAEPVAAQPDVHNTITQMRAAIERSHTRAVEVVDGVEAADRLLQTLRGWPADELRWADTWKTLLDDHGAVLTTLGPLKDWHNGRRNAQGSIGVHHWRTQVLPDLLASGVLDGNESLGVVADRLQAHLETTATSGSPYTALARQLLGTNDGSGSMADVAGLLEAAHLTDLFRMPLNSGGTLYRRSNVNLDDDLAHAIISRDDLDVPIMDLVPAKLPDGVIPAGSLIEVTESRMLEETIRDIDAGTPAGEALLNLLASLESLDDGDPIVRAQVQRLALQVLHDMIEPPADDPLARWLQRATASDSPLQENWPRLSYRGSRADRRELTRGLARLIADAPGRETLAAALEAPAAARSADAALAAPACVLFWRNGRWQVVGNLPDAPLLLQVTPAADARFVDLPVDGAGNPTPPSDFPPVPTLIYQRG